MKIAGINCNTPINTYGVKRAENRKNTFNTKLINNLAQDKVSFKMKGSGQVNNMKELVAYVGRDNAYKIIKTLQKCRYSKADVLTSRKTKINEKNGKIYLSRFNSCDDDGKLRGDCRELMIKAGKEINERCPDLKVRGMGIFNPEYTMLHCVLAITKKGSDEDKSVENRMFDLENDILVIDPSFRTYKIEHYIPLTSKICDIEEEENLNIKKNGTIELEVNKPIILGSYSDIASDLKLPQLSEQFGVDAISPLIGIYSDGTKLQATIITPEQKEQNHIISFTASNLEKHINYFLQNI